MEVGNINLKFLLLTTTVQIIAIINFEDFFHKQRLINFRIKIQASFLNKKSSVVRTQHSITLHYNRRKFHYKHTIHIQTLFFMFYSWMSYPLLYL